MLNILLLVILSPIALICGIIIIAIIYGILNWIIELIFKSRDVIKHTINKRNKE